MRLEADRFQLSASDLANHLGCHHLTQLDLAVAKGNRAPPKWRDPALEVLQERGLALEQAYLDHLRRQGFRIAEPGPNEDGPVLERTISAMRGGADIIYQATLGSDRWHGRADFLKRIERPSQLGAWSYEVLDAKLARDTRAGTVLQLCLYSHLVANIQGMLPERMHVIVPGDDFKPVTFRVHDFLAYHRLVQRQLEAAISGASDANATYPDPVPQCEICRWWGDCDRRRRDDDHLCLVAGISKMQINELHAWGVATLEDLAEVPLPLARKPARGAEDTYVRVCKQARVQLEGRRRGKPVYELLPVVEAQGLCRLPAPSPGDVFLDFESDPFVGTSGLEYLLGWTIASPGTPEYHRRWALDPATERAAFEAFIDLTMARWERWPDLHIYHFTSYEPAALKRLMGRYATREDQLDRLLRAKRFVDLHMVVKQALRAGVERYGLKELEVFYDFNRTVDLRTASLHLRAFERALELGRHDEVPQAGRDAIEAYNRDDSVSTMRLRDWLEQLRIDSIAVGRVIARPEPESGAATEALEESQQRVQELYQRLAGDVSPNPAERSDEQQARWVLANMLDWHRREKKAIWWEYFRLCELADEDLLAEKAALSGLEFVERIATPKRSVVDRYRFPPQECEIRDGDELRHQGNRCGEVAAIDVAACTIDIRKGPSVAELHPGSVFKHSDIRDSVRREALMRLGVWVAENGMDAPGPFRAGRDLLLRRKPRPGADVVAGQDTLTTACGWVAVLDHSVLPIQGPPGSGKTFTGAHMIMTLVRAGRKVGITALSHKAIRNLLDTVVEVAGLERTAVSCIQSVKEPSKEPCSAIIEVKGNDERPLQALRTGAVDVAAGTVWLWARPEYVEAVDVLFVDEAGQLSLADVLAVAQAAKSVVLLGDPQQLKQPQQGSHPEGIDLSALEHVLGKHETIPPDRGLFLDQTHRLHPNICIFTSELFYNSRLRSLPDLEHQVLEGPPPFRGAGLWFVPVPHEGNQSSSGEEVHRVVELVSGLTGGGVHWTDRTGARRPLVLADILVIAPYNAQVAALARRLPPGTRIGTVDKFQGQGAPVVICSLATSLPGDAPRGMDFLYSLNRLNVAVSRARTTCILVANPHLFEPDCRTPGQMRLANAFCRYLELAEMVPAR